MITVMEASTQASINDGRCYGTTLRHHTGGQILPFYLYHGGSPHVGRRAFIVDVTCHIIGTVQYSRDAHRPAEVGASCGKDTVGMPTGMVQGCSV